MRIVCISDNHGSHPSSKIPDGDILLHAGDISSDGSLKSVIYEICDLALNPHKYIILIGGNHDFALETDLSYIKEIIPQKVTILEDSSITIDGLKIWGTPVQPEFCSWAFNRTPEQRKKSYAAIPENTDILLTHCPPRGIFDRNAKGVECGCIYLLEVVNRVKPKLHVFGHIHEQGSKTFYSDDTIFVNASLLNEHYIDTNKPIVIDL